MAEWTPPKTWEPGEALTAPELNTHLRDNMIFLRSGRAAVLGMVSNTSISRVRYGRCSGSSRQSKR